VKPGRAVAGLLSLFLSLPIVADCSWQPRFSGAFRTTALDLAVDGNYLWVATGYGISLFERTSGGLNPLHSVALPGTSRTIVITGDGWAYAGSGSKVFALRRDGNRILIEGSAPASAAVNDLLLTSRLFAATSDGIDHFDVINRSTLLRSQSKLFTTTPEVSSLAVFGNTLYAADGDATIEVFSLAIPSLPQRTSTIEAMPLATAVHTTSDGRIVVSDRFGQTTDVYAGATRLSRVTFGASSFAPSGSVWFMAGPDRTVRAADFSNAARVAKLYESMLPASAGNDNAIRALARTGDDLYVAAGDIGLLRFDVSSIRKPWPLAGYTEASPATSVALLADRAWFAIGESIVQSRIEASGLSLEPERTWTAGPGALVHDATADFVLTSSGSSATLWRTAPDVPSAAVTATFSAAVTSAVIQGNSIVARLSDNSIWRADPAVSRVQSAPASAQIRRSGPALALIEIRLDGTTAVHYYETGDLANRTREVIVAGAAVGTAAMSGSKAALFTFNGINLIDLSTGASSVVPESNGFIPTSLAFSGGDLLAAEGRSLFVFENAESLAQQHPLPAIVNAMAANDTHAILATHEGTAAISPLASLPTSTHLSSNRFYTKVVAGNHAVALFGLDAIDLFETTFPHAPRFNTSIQDAGVIDIAAVGDRFYTLTANGIVKLRTSAGVTEREASIAESSADVARRIFSVAGAIWVAVFKGCSSGTCIETTLVLDPDTLAVTGSMSGGVEDVVASGNRAWTLTNLPRELRIIDVSNVQAPALLSSTARPVNSVSLAHHDGLVFVLGDQVYLFNDSTLGAAGERLTAGSVATTDRIRVRGNCAVITGRGSGAQLYALPSWNLAGSVETPGTLRSVALQEDRLFMLTTHSLEVWSENEATAGKRRSAR
jgi:hypothetical protein